jgi:hypothetical protein
MPSFTDSFCERERCVALAASKLENAGALGDGPLCYEIEAILCLRDARRGPVAGEACDLLC